MKAQSKLSKVQTLSTLGLNTQNMPDAKLGRMKRASEVVMKIWEVISHEDG